MHERDLFGQEVVDAELDDGVSLAAAHLHEGPGPSGNAGDRIGELLGKVSITIFVNVFHLIPPVVVGLPDISRR